MEGRGWHLKLGPNETTTFPLGLWVAVLLENPVYVWGNKEREGTSWPCPGRARKSRHEKDTPWERAPAAHWPSLSRRSQAQIRPFSWTYCLTVEAAAARERDRGRRARRSLRDPTPPARAQEEGFWPKETSRRGSGRLGSANCSPRTASRTPIQLRCRWGRIRSGRQRRRCAQAQRALSHCARAGPWRGVAGPISVGRVRGSREFPVSLSPAQTTWLRNVRETGCWRWCVAVAKALQFWNYVHEISSIHRFSLRSPSRLRGWQRMRWLDSITDSMDVWVNSGSWWWTGRPGVLQSVGSQGVGHDWETELNSLRLTWLQR